MAVLATRSDAAALNVCGKLTDVPNGRTHMGASDGPVFLRSNAIIEPLVDRFFAWMHIIAPVQASMNLANLQVPLLESYLQNPQVHLAASRNPALRGGYFVNIEESRSNEVAELLDGIKRDRADMLA